MNNYKLGAHLSIAGGYHNTLNKIVEIGGNCLQIFSSSPRGWSFAKIDDKTVKEFITLKSKLKIDPVYFHASYLINLAGNDRIGQLSKQSLIHELKIASHLDIKGTIVHLGSYKNNDNFYNDRVKNGNDKYEVLISNIREVLKQALNNTFFIIENAGNRKIGQTLDEISQIIKDVNDSRVRLCLDTCHLYSAGYDLSTPKKLDNFLHDFDILIGLEKLEVIHTNDSKDPFNSGRDRHENIGQGTVPINTFKLLLSHPKTKNLPFIIETPGFSNEGPDKKNLDTLKGLII